MLKNRNFRMKTTNKQRNEEAIVNDKVMGIKLNATLTIAPDGSISIPWWNGRIQEFINKIAPEQGKKMMEQNHLCG